MESFSSSCSYAVRTFFLKLISYQQNNNYCATIYRSSTLNDNWKFYPGTLKIYCCLYICGISLISTKNKIKLKNHHNTRVATVVESVAKWGIYSKWDKRLSVFFLPSFSKLLFLYHSARPWRLVSVMINNA